MPDRTGARPSPDRRSRAVGNASRIKPDELLNELYEWGLAVYVAIHSRSGR